MRARWRSARASRAGRGNRQLKPHTRLDSHGRFPPVAALQRHGRRRGSDRSCQSAQPCAGSSAPTGQSRPVVVIGDARSRIPPAQERGNEGRRVRSSAVALGKKKESKMGRRADEVRSYRERGGARQPDRAASISGCGFVAPGIIELV